MLKITLVKSLIGQLPATQKTAVSLGLKKIGNTKVVNGSDPSVQGKLAVVSHLIKVEEIAE